MGPGGVAFMAGKAVLGEGFVPRRGLPVPGHLGHDAGRRDGPAHAIAADERPLGDGHVKALGIHPVVLDWSANVVRVAMMLPWIVSNRRHVRERMKDKWLLAIAVGVLSPLSYILVLLALQIGAPLSLTAPAREMSMMVGALFGLFFLGEKVGPGRLLGCAILVGGVVLLGLA